jgi:yecA family protein
MLPENYADIQSALTEEHSLADAAEAHGTLSGSLCSVSDYRFEDWLGDILPEGKARPPSAALLRELYRSTAEALFAPDMGFDLLLPADDQSIIERAAALGLWCQGFLYGLGLGVLRDTSRMPDELSEIVEDITEIGRAAVDTDQSEESNEAAYAELVEFLRVSVQVVFEELAPLRESSAAPLLPGASFH